MHARLPSAVAAGFLVALCLVPAAAAGPRLYVGFSDDAAFRWSLNRQSNLDLAARHGATIVRVLVEWAKVAPRRPRQPLDPFSPAYRLDDLDELVRNAHERGLAVLLTIWGTPAWANGGRREAVAPRGMSDLRAFAHAVAARYSGRYPSLPFVRFFAAWNEPNSGLFLSPQFDSAGRAVAPRTYAAIVSAIDAGVKSASPQALVAAGETAARGRDRPVVGVHDSESPGRFAQLVAAAAPRLAFDAWAHHPYPASELQRPEAPQRWPDVGLSSLGRFSSQLARWFHRRQVRLWVTEYGYRSSPQVSDAAAGLLQAAYLGRAVMLARAQPTVDMFIWFRFRDAPGELSSGGLLDQAGRPKPALASFAAAADCYRLLADPCVEQAKLTAATRSGGVSSFGSGVALAADGNTALVGASGDDSAWIFSRSGSSWHPGRRLTPTDEDDNARFGSSVALSADGDTAVVGGAADDGGVGAVWVFVRSGSSWTQAGPKLTADDESGNGRFGGAVAVSADGATVLVGAHGDAAGLGAAWVFSSDGSAWTQQGPKLSAGEETAKGQFGTRVALSADGGTALIGGPNDNAGAGTAWIFTHGSQTWAPAARLMPNDENGAGAFGTSVALSADGKTALIGGPNDNNARGAAWLFTGAESRYRQHGSKLTPAGATAGGAFGTSLALAGNGATAVIGAAGDNHAAGAAWIFSRSGSHWTQQAERLTAPDAIGPTALGSTAALSADASTALLGGPGDNEYAGAAWTYSTPSTPVSG
jgi:hypothetical protein